MIVKAKPREGEKDAEKVRPRPYKAAYQLIRFIWPYATPLLLPGMTTVRPLLDSTTQFKDVYIQGPFIVWAWGWRKGGGGGTSAWKGI